MTYRCNLECDFCYNDALDTQELETGDYSRLADSICSGEAIPGVTLTGGEPLLRKDLEKIAQTFSMKGCSVAVATNGTLLSKERADSLTASGVSHFDIGFTSPSHETVMGITHAVRTGASVTASLCLHSANFGKTGLRVRTAAALGADSVCLNRFVPTGRGRNSEFSLRPREGELLQALQLAQDAADRCGIHLYTGIPFEPELAGERDYPAISFTTCRCGDTKWAIDPAGNLRTCEQSDRRLGNLLEMSFPEALARHSVEIREFRRSAGRGCRFLG